MAFSDGLATFETGARWALAGAIAKCGLPPGMSMSGRIVPNDGRCRLGASPFAQFQELDDGGGEVEPNDPNAMTVATATADGRPSLRAMLLKGVDHRGFVFYTNKESRKGEELGGQPARGAVVPLEVAAAADPDRGCLPNT